MATACAITAAGSHLMYKLGASAACAYGRTYAVIANDNAGTQANYSVPNVLTATQGKLL